MRDTIGGESLGSRALDNHNFQKATMSLHQFTVHTAEDPHVSSLDALRTGGALHSGDHREHGGVLHVEREATSVGQALIETLHVIEHAGLTPTGVAPTRTEPSRTTRQTITAADHLLRARSLLHAASEDIRTVTEHIMHLAPEEAPH